MPTAAETPAYPLQSMVIFPETAFQVFVWQFQQQAAMQLPGQHFAAALAVLTPAATATTAASPSFRQTRPMGSWQTLKTCPRMMYAT